MGKTIVINSLSEMCDLMCDNRLPRRNKAQDDYDACYATGIYEDYECSLCPHRYDCSGYEDHDED